MLRIAWRAATVAAVVIALTGTTEAYSRKDARYVTSSRNQAVLDYIICLEKAVGAKPKDLPEALTKAEKLCADAAQELPRSPDQPDAENIRMQILECGFKPEDPSPDAGC